MDYEVVRSDVPVLANRLCQLVRSLAIETGASRVHLVGHSLGGVIIRYAVSVLGLDPLVGAAITVASPHGGVPLAAVLPGVIGQQLRPGSAVLRLIEDAARPGEARWTAFYSNADMVVPASRARIRPAALAATNVLIPGEDHLSILLSTRLAVATVEQLVAADQDPRSSNEPVEDGAAIDLVREAS
jgi:pimeloyl-ACP methyl ester carboxylesterase